MNRELDVVSHYARFLGEPTRVAEINLGFDAAPSPILIAVYAPPSNDYDWVYVTIGACRLAMPDPDKSAGLASGRRMELMLYSRKHYDELPKMLATLASYPFVLNTYFSPGDRVAGRPDDGIVPGSPLTEILLTHPYPKPAEFETVQHEDGGHTHILWVVPIYLSERVYAREHGSRGLEALFGEKDADTSDFWRQPVV